MTNVALLDIEGLFTCTVLLFKNNIAFNEQVRPTTHSVR